MCLSSICKTIRHIYLNYHFGEKSSRWINSILTRHIQFAFRLIIVFSLACFISYGTILQEYLSSKFLIPNMTILLIQETFGLTLLINIQLMLIIIPLSIFLYILQKFHLIYQHYFLNEFFYLLTSLIISYKCTQIPTRKLSLLFNSIFFVTIMNENNLPLFFIFKLLGEFLIGIFLTIIISLFIFPLFATFDIENRINYCLSHLQKMYYLIIEAYLSKDEITANIYLSRVNIIEKMIRQTTIIIQSRFDEIYYEPSRLLQKIFNRKRRFIIDLTIQEQEDLICSLMSDICSLELVVKQCKFNEYHNDYIKELKANLLNLNSCQSLFISYLIRYSFINENELKNLLKNLRISIDSVRLSYNKSRLQRIQNSFQSLKLIQSEDHLSHAFFLFHLNSIVQLLIQTTIINQKNNQIKKRKSFKKYFQFDSLKFLTALKTMIIIGIGSIFAMNPYLAKKFENGQWILIALCMTQGDTVGGAFTVMKMRLIGTLIGTMWAYITYLSAGNDVYKTLLMLCPWIFFCGYMKLYPQWGYTFTVAASTPIVVNLGRLPFADSLPAGNYAILRIQQNVIGISIGLVLAIIIFPVFAIDLLKENIHKTLEFCINNIESNEHIYNKIFHHKDNKDNLIDISNIDDIKIYINNERCNFNKLINIQRILIDYASIEPCYFWLNNGFSSSRYKILLQQQIDIYRMLFNINTSLIYINEYSNNNKKQIEEIRINTINSLFLPDFYNEFNNLNKKLTDCLKIWSLYFNSTQTKSYKIYHWLIYHKKHLIENDSNKYEKCLIELYQMIIYLQNQHQKITNQVLKYYFSKFISGEIPENFIPFIKNEQIDSIFIAISSMYYSIIQLAKSALILGTTIHDIYELEITNVYQPF